MLKWPHLRYRQLLVLFAVAPLLLSVPLNLVAHSRQAILQNLHRLIGSRPAVEAGARRAMARPQFVLFGDSLTQHSFDEGSALQHRYLCISKTSSMRATSIYRGCWGIPHHNS